MLQTFAWVGMAINFSQTESVSTALIKTFDGNNPCKVCKFVEEGKKTESESKSQVEVKKMEIFNPVGTDFYFPLVQHRSLSPVFVLLSRAETPPTPPPLRA
ncbi:MAG: hypothetical protein H0X66_19645 [Verrucomicrobia bacterium]|nr:hypothetical protein [Verrucomicrobiota bacterium]